MAAVVNQTFHVRDYPNREAQWAAANKWWRQK